MMGELLNKMPGIDVDAQGVVSVMGKIVRRVEVNGRPFFSDDPTIAINHLPSDLAYHIEIFEDRSDEAKFTGVDDGVRVLTINIVTKREILKAVLGDVHAGYGTENLYNAGANLHYIDRARTASLIATDGNSPAIMGGGVPTNSIGITLPKTYQSFSGNVRLADSCFANRGYFDIDFKSNHIHSNSFSTSNTEYLLPGDSVFFGYNFLNRYVKQANNTGTLLFIYRLGIYDQFILNAEPTWGRSITADSAVARMASGDMLPVNSSVTQTNSDNSNSTIPLTLSYGHRFHQKGRSLFIRVSSDHSTQNSSGTQNYSNQYYLPSGDSSDLANQYFTSPTNIRNYSFNGDYSESVGRRSTFQIHYSYIFSTNNNNRSVLFRDSTTGSLRPDSSLSDDFYNRSAIQTIGLSYIGTFSHNLTIIPKLDVQEVNVTGNGDTKQPPTALNYFTAAPKVNLLWSFATGKSLTLDYSGHTDVPSTSELQPVINNSDPLHVWIGNPALKESYSHSWSAGFRNMWNGRSGFAYAFWMRINGSLTQNQIQQKTYTNLVTGADTTTPVNLNGNYDLDWNSGYTFPLSRNSHVDLSCLLDDRHGVGYVNGQLNPSSTYIARADLKWKGNFRKYLDANLTCSAIYTAQDYSALPANNLHFWHYRINSGVTLYSNSGWQWQNQIDFESWRGRSVLPNPTFAIWNMALKRQILQKRQVIIEISIHDILNQSQAVSDQFSTSTIRSTQIQLLKRFVLLSFIYNLHAIRQGRSIENPE
jgi:hypothetical protein